MHWARFFRIDDNFAKEGYSSVTAIARNPDHLHLFVTGTDNGIYSTYWDNASPWKSCLRIDDGFAKGANSVAAVARDPDHLDLFVTGTDGGIYSTYWDSASGWAWWFRINDDFAKGRSPVTAISRGFDHLDLFIGCTDGGIYWTYWGLDPWPLTQLEGYVSSESVLPDEPLTVHVRSTIGPFRIQLLRRGLSD